MYLLDTNALIIHYYKEMSDSALSKKAQEIIRTSSDLFVSIVSFWEIAIKMKANRISIDNSIKGIVNECSTDGISIIPLNARHLDIMLKVVFYDDHKDPFDRLLLSTAMSEQMTLISTDQKMKRYNIDVIS